MQVSAHNKKDKSEEKGQPDEERIQFDTLENSAISFYAKINRREITNKRLDVPSGTQSELKISTSAEVRL